MKHIRITILLLLISLGASSQTLQQGRTYFSQGDYEKAKPIMLKYLKQKPDDASRNYWYGICCMETGEQDKAIPYLEKAAAKKIFKAYRALGEYYLERENYQPAITNLEAFVKGISSDKELHDDGRAYGGILKTLAQGEPDSVKQGCPEYLVARKAVVVTLALYPVFKDLGPGCIDRFEVKTE